jgi:hypothetical protein
MENKVRPSRKTGLKWNLGQHRIAEMGRAFVQSLADAAHKQAPDLPGMFPFHAGWELNGHLGDKWIAARLIDTHTSGVPIVGKLQHGELQNLTAKILPFVPRSHPELWRMLGSVWFGFDRFAHVGPYEAPFACWPDAADHPSTFYECG